MDLRAVCWGKSRWSARRVLTHVENLPRDSAYVRALQGDRAYWDEQAEVTASVVDALKVLSYYLLKVNGNEADPPEVYPRPGTAPAEPETVSLSDFNDFLKG